MDATLPPIFSLLPPRAAWAALLISASLGLSATSVMAQSAEQTTNPGAYLAAVYAAAHGDFDEAAGYFTRALAADPGNAAMQQGALVAQIARNDLTTARAMVGAMSPDDQARLVPKLLKITAAAKTSDFQAVLDLLAQGHADDAGQNAEGDMLTALQRAWVLQGLGQMSDAVKEFDRVIAQPGISSLGRYHKALAVASVGDFETAEKLMTGESGTEIGLGRRGVIAHAQILTQLERRDDAVTMLNRVLEAGDDPVLAALRDRLVAGEAVQFDIIQSPAEGLAEVLFSFSGAMIGAEMADTSGLIYARLAADLNPRNDDARIVAAGLLEQGGQTDLALATYDAIDPATPAGVMARLGKANALAGAGRMDEAVATAQALAGDQPGSALVWLTLGDLLRRTEAFADAALAYDHALEVDAEKGRTAPWYAIYARGIAHERAGQWDKAEPDFRRALEQSPDQPEVLNYLGYSYVDRNQNLDEALALIAKAVEARPDDGYIQDSLGWAYYRMGRYADAVAPMEEAVIRMSEDPLVNDHLGDVYWAVGRKREAGVQWRRALSLVPGAETEDEVDPDRIRLKLEQGLDAVLAQEGAKPLHDGN